MAASRKGAASGEVRKLRHACSSRRSHCNVVNQLELWRLKHIDVKQDTAQSCAFRLA